MVLSESLRDSLQEVLEKVLTKEPSGRGRALIPVTWASSAGLQRKENQDRIVAGQRPSGYSVAVLADGMGGLEDGGRAAAVAASAAAASALQSQVGRFGPIAEEAIRFANRRVFGLLKGRGGAAVVLAIWSATELAVAHAGDARAYAIGPDGFPVQLTIDDTVEGQFKRLGREKPVNPDRGLIQFVGVGSDLDVHAQTLSTRPRGLILTSDGVHGMPEDVFRWAVHRTSHLQALADRLVQLSEWNGGADNASVICIGAQNGSDYRGSAVECWVPGDHVVLVEDWRSRVPQSPPAREPLHTTSQVTRIPAKQTPDESRSKKGSRGKSTAKRGKRSAEKAPPPAPPIRHLPIEVTFESPEENDIPQPKQPEESKSPDRKG